MRASVFVFLCFFLWFIENVFDSLPKLLVKWFGPINAELQGVFLVTGGIEYIVVWQFVHSQPALHILRMIILLACIISWLVKRGKKMYRSCLIMKHDNSWKENIYWIDVDFDLLVKAPRWDERMTSKRTLIEHDLWCCCYPGRILDILWELTWKEGSLIHAIICYNLCSNVLIYVISLATHSRVDKWY